MRGMRAIGLVLAILAAAPWAAAEAATPREIEPEALFPEGCFPGDRRDADIYEVELDVFPAIKPKPDLGFGPRLARLRYPAACDAGNWNRTRLRRSTAINLHGHVADGTCLTYDEWTERNPWQEDRFTISLNAYAPMSDFTPVLQGRRAEIGRPYRWRPRPPDATGLQPLDLTSAEAPVDDILDRWAKVDADGRLTKYMLCRKADSGYNPACELHAPFDQAHLTLNFSRRHLARLDEIEGFARKMLRCALDRPLPRPPRQDG